MGERAHRSLDCLPTLLTGEAPLRVSLDAPFDQRAADWLSYSEALARILEGAAPLPPERIPIGEAVSRVLSGTIRSRFRLPPWDNSAMDGYAVRHADLSAGLDRLRVCGEARAGGPDAPRVGPGEAVRIMTGAPLPTGADTIVRAEDTRVEGDQVRILSAPARLGHSVRRGGEDFETDEILARPGEVVAPGRLALLIAAGCTHVEVHRRPRVVVLAAGDELLPPGSVEEVTRGRGVIDSNSPMLCAQARAAGALANAGPSLPDEVDAISQAFRDAGSADLLVTVGGASVGAHDLFKRVLDGLGYRPAFWRVRMRPGSPVSFGTLTLGTGSVPVLGLPGNPTSAFVTFELFGRPFLHALSGLPERGLVPGRARAEAPLKGAPGLTVFARVGIRSDPAGGWLSYPSGPQGSGLISPLAQADALAVIPADPGHLEAGASHELLWLPTSCGTDRR